MAILYRPITKHKFDGMKWAFKNTFKIAMGEAENLFKYYELEKYDSSKRGEQANKLGVLPAVMGLGALSFFLGVGNLSLTDSLISTNQMSKSRRKAMMKFNLNQYKNIMGGFTRYMSWEKLPSFKWGVRTTFSL